MGVKDLWNILSPLSERKPLYELQGKTIAIDLSCWVMDSQTVTNNIAQPKMHLRNLFFRTSYFLLHDISPVFVLEGTAPNLKHKTIEKRNDTRQGGEERKKVKEGGNKGRTRFNYVLRECEEMLSYMGVTCVKGYGEAEAMCAYLNQDGLVDGCISQDSDCFLYGAKVVYRNFCTSSQGNRATSNGSIDEYSMEKIERVFNLGRNKMIALALLCGCDYDEGISGVGKESALKLFQITENSEILTRLKEWRTDSKYKRMEFEISNSDICTNCGHSGKMRFHTKIGCVDCGTSVKCNNGYKQKRALISNELSIRKKALSNENFPNQELIDEFLIRKGPVPSKLDLKWRKPMIIKFIGFMEKNVQWEPAYAFAKIFPLLTRWQLLNLVELPLERRLLESQVFVPEKIKKIRNIRGVASYEILWLDEYNLLEGLTLTTLDSEKHNDEEETPDALSELVTIEPQAAVSECYPNIVEEFQALRNAKKKKPTRGRKKKVDENEEPKEKKETVRKRAKSKSNEVADNKKILDFVTVQNQLPTLEESLKRISITPKRRKREENHIPSIKKRGPQFDKVMTVERMDSILNGSLEDMFNELTPEDFPSEDDDCSEMSFIINKICNKDSTPKNLYIEYQENLEETDDEIIFKKHEEILNNSVQRYPEDKRRSVLKEINKDDTDEFDILDTSYVPLDKRLCTKKRQSLTKVRVSSPSNLSADNFSMGIDNLLNGTDD